MKFIFALSIALLSFTANTTFAADCQILTEKTRTAVTSIYTEITGFFEPMSREINPQNCNAVHTFFDTKLTRFASNLAYLTTELKELKSQCPQTKILVKGEVLNMDEALLDNKTYRKVFPVLVRTLKAVAKECTQAGL